MSRHLKKHLPDFVSSLKEFEELDKTISIELDLLRTKIEQLQNNQFIYLADEQGISRFEKMLGIQKVDDIESRRLNILMKFNSQLPFTYRWLVNFLNTTLGQDKYQITLYPEDYHLVINVADDKSHLIDTLTKDLRAKIPANLLLTITTLNSIESQSYAGYTLRIADIITI